MSDEKTYEGQCYCGAVKIAVTGESVGAGYCHCKNCRSWSAGPVNAFTLWPTDAFEVTEGAEHIGEYNANENTYRQWCTQCGGHLVARHPGGTWSTCSRRRSRRTRSSPGCTSTTSRPCCR